MATGHASKSKPSHMTEEDFEWVPPSEAEMKILQAKRERSDQISKLMGDYLLKGYKMLATECEKCETILLQDKQGKNLCIACVELDSDVSKDNPAISSQAAKSQVKEYHHSMSFKQSCDDERDICETGETERDSVPQIIDLPTLRSKIINPHNISRESGQKYSLPKQPIVADSRSLSKNSTTCILSNEKEIVQEKLRWAASELNNNTNVSASIELCKLIKICGETLLTLNQIDGES